MLSKVAMGTAWEGDENGELMKKFILDHPTICEIRALREELKFHPQTIPMKLATRSPGDYMYPKYTKTFDHKTLLITGATGLVGKVLLEKLLRSCPSLNTVYLLIRCSKNCRMTATERMLDTIDRSLPLKKLFSEVPTLFEKLRPIAGDVTVKRLGISDEKFFGRIDQVSFIFHCAAVVRFDAPARKLLDTNFYGVYNLMEMCKGLKHLEAVVHVSTAYSFCNRPLISEFVYEDGSNSENLLTILKNKHGKQLEDLCDFFSNGRPSLYHYSKAIAEILIAQKYSDLPAIIVRPSIITAAFREPMPGWIDTINGPSGFIALSSKGILKTLLLKKGVNADWIPVDIVVNTLVEAALYRANESSIDPNWRLVSDRIPVINCLSQNTIKWSAIVDMCIPLLHVYPSETLYRLPGGVVTSCPLIHALCKLVLHYLPAVIIDCGCFLVRKEVGLVRSYRRIHGVLNHLQVYTTQEFVFESENMYRLATHQNTENIDLFPIHQHDFQWPSYLNDYVQGVRKFYLQESDETLPSARRRLSKLRLMWKVTKWLSAGALVGLVVRFGKWDFEQYLSAIKERLDFSEHLTLRLYGNSIYLLE